MTENLLQFPSEDRVTHAVEVYRIRLNNEEVAYTLKRCKRKTIGMRIDSNGLTVSIPLRGSLRWVESALRDKADWVVKKLAEWGNKKSTQLVWEETALFPLLGEPWQLTTTAPGIMRMIRAKMKTETEGQQLALPLPSVLAISKIEKTVMAWYRQHALTCFNERIVLYAHKLGVPQPQLRLSHARTQWGSCNTRGIVRLNWRLIQMPLSLVDYVVAHELSHLIEMNHSPAFWQIVASIYPDYLLARKELRKLG